MISHEGQRHRRRISFFFQVSWPQWDVTTDEAGSAYTGVPGDVQLANGILPEFFDPRWGGRLGEAWAAGNKRG
jgi:hypothetical protein